MRDRTSINVESLFLRPMTLNGVQIERPAPTPRNYPGIMWPALYRGWTTRDERPLAARLKGE